MANTLALPSLCGKASAIRGFSSKMKRANNQKSSFSPRSSILGPLFMDITPKDPEKQENHENDLSLFLSQAELEIKGRMPNSSNATLLVLARSENECLPAIYKPERGERPLWDFPRGTLCRREVAAYALSEVLDLHIVPPTILRDGPYGIGSVQLFIREDRNIDIINMIESGHEKLLPFAFFDVIANNADRKISHCLSDKQGEVWGIDHGLTFHDEPKLRTVLWHWAGRSVPAPLLTRVTDFSARLEKAPAAAKNQPIHTTDLHALLSPREIEALVSRADLFAQEGIFPHPDPYGHAIPWPPY